MNTKNIPTALSNEQRAVLRTQTIEAEKTPAEWLAFLQPMVMYARKQDSTTRQSLWVRVGKFLWTVLGFRFFVRRSKLFDTRSLESNVEKLVLPFLHILHEELPSGEKLYLHLNLCPLAQTAPVQEVQPKNKTDNPHIVIKWFKKPWLRAVTRLSDGTALRLHITDVVRKTEKRRRIIRYTSRRTKTKTKTKVTFQQRSFVVFAIGFRADSYALQEPRPLLPTSQKMTVQSGEKRHWLKMHRRVKFLTQTYQLTSRQDHRKLAVTPFQTESIPLNDVMGMVTTAFQTVTPLRKFS